MQAMRSIKLLVEIFVIGRNVDAEFFHQCLRDVAVGCGAFDGKCAPETEQFSVADGELIAFGMAAEVVVIFDDQYFDIGSGTFAEEVRGGEPADTAADYDQIVTLAGVLGSTGMVPEGSI